MKLTLEADSPEELISALPVVRQDVPTITGLRAELRLIRRLTMTPMILGMTAVALLVGGGGLMLALWKIFPNLEKQSGGLMMVWFVVMLICFIGPAVLSPILPWLINRRIRGREAVFCDPQLIGSQLDLMQTISSTDSSSGQNWYAQCLSAWLKRTLPEWQTLETADLTQQQRSFLTQIALTQQNKQEDLVLAVLRSAPIWGDVETLAAILMISRTGETEAIRTTAYHSLAPLQIRLQSVGADIALVNSLTIPAAAV